MPILVTTLIMLAITIVFFFLELKEFINAVIYEVSRTRGIIGYLTLLFRLLWHIPKLIPAVLDIGSIWAFGLIFNLGSGLFGGIGTLLASNIFSIFIYYHTHLKKEEKLRGCMA